MEMPRPGEAHARLQKLVGRWRGEETVHPAPWDKAGGTATAVVENRVVLGGFAVVQEYQQTRAGKPNFAGHGVFWWDPAANQHVMTWFDAMSGTPTEYRGTFDGDVLRLEAAVPQGGFSRCTFECGTPDRYVFRLEVSQDGDVWAPALEGAYARVRPPAARPAVARGGVRKTVARAPADKPSSVSTLRGPGTRSKARPISKTAAARPRRATTGRTTAKRFGRGGRRR